MSSPIPIAAATGSSIRYTSLALALSPESLTARLSTSVTPEGTHMTILGLANLFKLIFLMNPCNIPSVILKSAITPSCNGLMVSNSLCVLPSIAFASSPTATIESSSTLRVTIDGSFTTMPLPFSQIRVLAVPRSMATSPEIQFNTLGI